MQGKDGSASKKVFLVCLISYNFKKKNFNFDEILYNFNGSNKIFSVKALTVGFCIFPLWTCGNALKYNFIVDLTELHSYFIGGLM